MKVLVVDDERLARSRLLRMLQQVPGVESVAEAENGRKALDQIERFDPSVVLLDIRMPDINGLDVARVVSRDRAVIFTTAYDEHAVEAFEVAAIDYLLKPIRLERLKRALERASELTRTAPQEGITELYDRLLAPQGPEPTIRITARSRDSLRVFDLVEIDRFSAGGGYTSFQQRGEEFLLNESLSTLEEKLRRSGFLRIHRSELIRIDAVTAIHNEEGATTVELSRGERAPVSRRLLASLKSALGIR